MSNGTLPSLAHDSYSVFEGVAAHMHSPLSVSVLSTAALFCLAITFTYRSKNRLPLPPGPPRWPLLGNALDRPRGKEWHAYTEWGKQYGP